MNFGIILFINTVSHQLKYLTMSVAPDEISTTLVSIDEISTLVSNCFSMCPPRSPVAP